MISAIGGDFFSIYLASCRGDRKSLKRRIVLKNKAEQTIINGEAIMKRRLAAWTVSTIPTFVMSAQDNLKMGLLYTVLTASILEAASYTSRALQSPTLKMRGAWIKFQRQTRKICIFNISLATLASSIKIAGDVYSIAGRRLSSWTSSHVQLTESGRAVACSYSGTAPGLSGNYDRPNTPGRAYYNFEIAQDRFRRGHGFFIDRAPSSPGGRKPRWGVKLRRKVTTEFYRIDKALVMDLGLPDNFRLEAPGSREMLIKAFYAYVR